MATDQGITQTIIIQSTVEAGQAALMAVREADNTVKMPDQSMQCLDQAA